MSAPAAGDAELGLRPLAARSVILSTLLGSHPPELPVRAVIRIGELFSIAPGTVRVALSRMAAEGDVTTSEGWYRLSNRLVERQRRQDEGRRPRTRPWRGLWELAVLDEPGVDGTAVQAALARLRLAPLGSGVWIRPANLARPWPPAVEEACRRFEARPDEDARQLATRLWDLGGWSARAESLRDALAAAHDPARRFVIGAAMLRHLERDPLLPDALLPTTWPGRALRRDYQAFAVDLARVLRSDSTPELSARHSAK